MEHEPTFEKFQWLKIRSDDLSITYAINTGGIQPLIDDKITWICRWNSAGKKQKLTKINGSHSLTKYPMILIFNKSSSIKLFAILIMFKNPTLAVQYYSKFFHRKK